MSFGNLTALYLLLPALAAAVLLLLWAVYARRRALLRLADAELAGRLAAEIDPRRRWLRAALVLAALVLLILSAARLRAGLASELARKEGIDLIVALDVSKSMAAADIKPSRFDRAVLELQELFKRLRGDRVAIVIFSGSAFVQCPLTTDYPAAQSFLRAVRVGAVPQGGTAIAEAIQSASQLLSMSDNKSRVIMLLTDGENTEGDPFAAAKKAAELGINIFAIGIGAESGEPIPIAGADGQANGYQKDRQGKIVLSRLDEHTLMEIARITKGDYRRADAGGLGVSALWQDIEKLERGLIETRIFTKFDEKFGYFLLPAILFLLAELLLPERRKQPKVDKITVTTVEADK